MNLHAVQVFCVTTLVLGLWACDKKLVGYKMRVCLAVLRSEGLLPVAPQHPYLQGEGYRLGAQN